MTVLLHHLPILPIAIPLVAGAALLLLSEPQRTARAALTVGSVGAQLAVAAALLFFTSEAAPEVWEEGIGVYALGGWGAPFGIVLVADHLSAMMLTLAAVVGLAALIHSLALARPGQPFHSLLQFLMMGLNGAFLTGDLFTLFVFFEVLLAASYGLALRGAGAPRVRAALHYIAVNLVASFLFLLGVALIYGVAGTLSMADLPGRVAILASADRRLLEVGATLLGIAFLIKAGGWPFNFWLPITYSAALAPVAAAFAMMTKVGVYAVLRVGTLIDADEQVATMLGLAMFYIGFATLVAGTIGMLSALHPPRLVAYSVIVSTGILLASLGLGIEALTAPALYYLVTSVLTTAVFFLLTGMTERMRTHGMSRSEVPEPAAAHALPEPAYVAFGVREPDPYATGEGGIAIPAAMAFLGLVFVSCALLVVGLPPLPGFVAKFALLATAIGAAPAADVSLQAWMLAAGVLGSGFVAVLALVRTGVNLFWTVTDRPTPRLRLLEAVPVAMLVLLCIAQGLFAGPVMSYLEATARSLHDPQTYVRTVLSYRPPQPDGGPGR